MALVSVVIPAFRAEATIGAAVASVLAGGLPASAVEILIESDDGSDYAEAAALSSAISVQSGAGFQSGVGPARNRAIARASGSFLAFLDADDRFAPGYLAALLPLARQSGAAAAPLQIIENDQPILRLWQSQPRLGYADLAETGASARLMVARALCPPFVDALSQDILHALEVMAARGGSLPLSDRAYQLYLRSGSVTDAADFSARVHAAYLDHIARLAHQPEAAAVFQAKIALNAEFARQPVGKSYYAFIAEKRRVRSS